MTKSQRHFDHAVVAVQLDYITCPSKNCAATLAPTNVLVHGSAQPGIHFAVEII
jgi:hypothetical protein